MPPSYDPELNLIYFGTSVTAPTPKYLMAGNDKTYLYHTSTLALDAEHRQDRLALPAHHRPLGLRPHVRSHPGRHPGRAATGQGAAGSTRRSSPAKNRKVLTGIPGKTGIVYTLDRKTGEFLWAEPTVRQTVVSSIDGATGKVTMNPGHRVHAPTTRRSTSARASPAARTGCPAPTVRRPGSCTCRSRISARS